VSTLIWTAALIILLSGGLISLVLTALGHFAVFKVLSRPIRLDAPLPPVSILKPLKGLDDELYENLASFARQDYPTFELILGAEDPVDPALEVAQRIRRDFPDVAISVGVSPAHIGRNPKVNNLTSLTLRARHQYLLVSDSNARAHRSYLRETMSEFADPRVGLVTHPVVGDGEMSLSALMENLQLSSFVIRAMCGAVIFTRHALVVGKSMVFRRADLERLGGWHSVRNVLAEDYVLGRKFEKAGMRVALAPRPLVTVNRSWPLRRFMNRHIRWAQLRRRIRPFHFACEPAMYPVVFLAPALVLAATGTTLPPISAQTVACVCIAGIALKSLSDCLVCRRVRGRFPGPFQICLIQLKDLLINGLWLVAAFKRTIQWRGTLLRIGRGSRLLAIHPPQAGEESEEVVREPA
jgi:ceramide glucosyltransferase